MGSWILFTVLLAGAQEAPDGFGASTKGGEGGDVLTVTTLKDRGAGSLREALARRGPRVIRFGVEGTIVLERRIRVEHGRVTLAGETAPGKGITLLNHGIQFVGDCDDIIVRHLRIRVTTGGSSGDCLLFWGNKGGAVERVLVDHCSLIGATDEGFNTWGNVRDLTCRWTIIAEGPNKADHPKGFHNYGWLSGKGSDRITIHHCLFADNIDRSPKLSGGVYDLVNNVISNWSNNNATKIEEGARVNVVRNCYLPGPRSRPERGCVFVEHPEKGTRIFAEGNVSPLTPTGKEDPALNVTWYEPTGGRSRAHHPAPAKFFVLKKFEAPSIDAQSAEEAKRLVLERAGARVRDAEDERVLKKLR